LYRETLGNDGKTTLVYSQLDGDAPITWSPSNFCLFSYRKIALELWQLFKQVHAAPAMRPHHREVQVELHFDLSQVKSQNINERKVLQNVNQRLLTVMS
jgi:hypothetical protein